MATILGEVSDFLASGPLKMFIGGQWVDAVRKGRFETRDPGSGKVLAEVAAAEQEDVNLAVEAAQQAFKTFYIAWLTWSISTGMSWHKLSRSMLESRLRRRRASTYRSRRRRYDTMPIFPSIPAGESPLPFPKMRPTRCASLMGYARSSFPGTFLSCC